ncbi:MAG: class I SAM-dependent methyltransferase [Nanobdellota archaeon]
MVNGVNRSYEDKIKKRYSEFKDVGIGTWNAVKFKGRFINMYSDKEMIRELFTNKIKSNFKEKKDLVIIDFGGGDGVLLSIIKNQLKDCLNVEACNLDLNAKSLEVCKINNPEIQTIKHDLLQPYKQGCADVILCRFVMQYQSKEEQLIILKNAYTTLKQGGLFFVLWPSHPEKDFINNMEAETVSIITGKDKKLAKLSRYFPSIEEMTKNLEKAGFEILSSNKDKIKQYYTVEGWTDRFNLTKDQEIQLTNLFNKYEKKFPDLFEVVEGKHTHHSYHSLIVAKK